MRTSRNVTTAFIVVAFMLGLTAQTASTQETGTSAPLTGAKFCSEKKMHGTALPSPTGIAASPTHCFDVLDYTLNFDIYNCFLSPYPHSYTGVEVITFRVDTMLNTIALDAVITSLTIDSVSLAGAAFSHSGAVLTVTLDRTYLPGETAQVRIVFRHNEVNDHSFYTSAGMVFTDCEPQGARRWFPCWDRPSDKATFDLTARVPVSALLGSNGRLADSTTVGDTATVYHWVSRDPVATYLMVMTGKVGYNLDIVQWHKISDTSQTVPMRFYWNSGETESNLHHIESIILPMTTRYSQLFGEHPFEKNGFATIAAGAGFPWGGMENQTLTSLCSDCWSDNLVSHEFAHQWFGDMITCGTWADVWLNEGFATYCEALWDEYTGGNTAYKNAINNDAGEYITFNPGWPIYNPSWAISPPGVGVLFNTAITYDKGACVLHMLRYTLGDSLFFAAIKAYATDTLNFKYKSAITADFLAKISSVAGQDMSWFGNWLYLPNHPAYHNSFAITPQGGGMWKISFTTKQTQGSFFPMPLELDVYFTTGPDTIIRVMNSTNGQTFTFSLNRQPTSLVFDPNDNIVLKSAATVQTAVSEDIVHPLRFALEQCYPNPFNPSTSISYELPEASHVTLTVFDVLGRELAILDQGQRGAGTHLVVWEAGGRASGIYYYRIRATDSRGETFEETKSMVLLK